MKTNSVMRHLLTLLFLSFLAVGCASTKTNESTGEFIDDSAITAKIKAELLADKTTPGMSIQKETFNGRVQLCGFVNTQDQAKRAEQVAAGIKGVKAVTNNIEIK